MQYRLQAQYYPQDESSFFFVDTARLYASRYM